MKKIFRLITYGTLSPGQINNHHLDAVSGKWTEGTVKGRLLDEGWGAGLGFPGMVLDDSADYIDVFVLESVTLDEHWYRIDNFEGEGYTRVLTKVNTKDGQLDAYIYVVKQ